MTDADDTCTCAVDQLPPLVVTVCDQAHEALGGHEDWLHWSVLDPVSIGSAKAFDATVRELRHRIGALLDTSVADS